MMDNFGRQIVLGRIPDAATNYQAASELQSAFPLSFRKAQDVLVAVKKMRQGSGWFSSENVRIRKAQEEVYALAHSLRREDFCSLPAMLSAAGKTKGELTNQESVFVFMNFFAQVFPNWRPEYEALNRFVPQLY
jgi:hypothetical protein